MRLQALPNAESHQGTNLFIFSNRWIWSKVGQWHDQLSMYLKSVVQSSPCLSHLEASRTWSSQSPTLLYHKKGVTIQGEGSFPIDLCSRLRKHTCFQQRCPFSADHFEFSCRVTVFLAMASVPLPFWCCLAWCTDISFVFCNKMLFQGKDGMFPSSSNLPVWYIH